MDFGKHLHARIAALYEDPREQAEPERVKMLEHLFRHEHYLEQTPGCFENEVRGGLLEAWEYSPSHDVDAVMAVCTLQDKPATDAVFSGLSPSTKP